VRAVATVLYEDQRAPQRTRFGPHALVIACVADETGTDRWTLEKRIEGIPKKGDSKLLWAVREDAANLTHDGRALVAVFDDDRVRKLLGLDGRACKTLVKEAIAAGGTAGTLLEVVLLQRNIEDVVVAAARALGRPMDDPQVVRALGKHAGHPEARDAILHAAAASADVAVRQAILAAVPSFARVVRGLVARAGAAEARG
jgi:hypothetical protein